MTWLEGAALWLSVFAQVALLGFQSRNVNAGRYGAAACTSLCISASQLIAIRGIASGDPWVVFGLTALAGPAGICFAIYVSKRLYK